MLSHKVDSDSPTTARNHSARGPVRHFLTGRYSIRSGNHSVPIGALHGWGLVAWEKTLGDLLTPAGYACAVYGKWHVGEGSGRWPTDKGFEEWCGPPRTYDEALWPTDPWYDPKRDPVSRMVEIKRGERDVTQKEQLTLDVRRDCDTEYMRRAQAFIRRNARDSKPFFVYFNHSLMHMPVIPRSEFKGKTGQGDRPTVCWNSTRTLVRFWICWTS
jgi:arylsulfatase A-like enzyme